MPSWAVSFTDSKLWEIWLRVWRIRGSEVRMVVIIGDQAIEGAAGAVRGDIQGGRLGCDGR